MEEITKHRATLTDQHNFIQEVINNTKTRMQAEQDEIVKCRSEMVGHEQAIVSQREPMLLHEQAVVVHAKRGSRALEVTREVDQRMATLKTGRDEHIQKSGDLFQQVDGLIAKTRAETQEASVKMQRGAELMVDSAKSQMGSGSTHSGEGRGGGGSKDKKVDKKEIAARTLPE